MGGGDGHAYTPHTTSRSYLKPRYTGTHSLAWQQPPVHCIITPTPLSLSHMHTITVHIILSAEQRYPSYDIHRTIGKGYCEQVYHYSVILFDFSPVNSILHFLLVNTSSPSVLSLIQVHEFGMSHTLDYVSFLFHTVCVHYKAMKNFLKHQTLLNN